MFSLIYDVTIVGAGPAGLSAALILGRCLRRVYICDAGHPRNEAARVFNSYLSRDAFTPAEFLQISRDQLRRYETVELRNIEVVDAQRLNDGFTVILATGEHVQSRMLLLATGLVDVIPEIPGLRKFYGKSAFNCPYCDAWECRGQAIAVVGGNQAAADLAVELLLWSKDVILCTNGDLVCDERVRKQMERGGIGIIAKPIARLEGEGDTLSGVRFTDGTVLSRTALFFSPEQFQRAPFAERLGCKPCEGDTGIDCAEDASTCIPGLYIAGNASRGVQLVIAAAAEGASAGIAINNALLEADAESGDLAPDAGPPQQAICD